MNRPRYARVLLASLALFCGVTALGCATWKAPSTLQEAMATADRSGGETRLTNKKRLVLQVEFANLPVAAIESDPLANSWQWVDETPIKPAVRRRLLANGIRVGVVTDAQRFRDRVQQSAAEPDVLDTFLSQASIASEVAEGEKQIPMRYGRRYELPVRKPSEGKHVTLVQLGDETVGQTLANAQYLFAVTARETTTPQQIELRLRPEVQYGETKQKFVSSDTALRIDTRRESWSIEPLEFHLQLQEGDTFVIAPTMPLKGLAKQMLSSPGPDQQPQQTVMLVRVAQVPTAVDRL